MRKVMALMAILSALILGTVTVAGPAQAAGNCSISSGCYHLFHITDGDGHAADVTLYYDVRNGSESSSYKEIGCGQVKVKTNPNVNLDALRIYIENEPDEYVTIGGVKPCVQGGSASTNNDVGGNSSNSYSGTRPYQGFYNGNAPYVKATIWGLTGASDGARSQYWPLP